MVALVDAINGLQRDGLSTDDPLNGFVAGFCWNLQRPAGVDLDYLEDSGADSDFNLWWLRIRLIEIHGPQRKPIQSLNLCAT